MGSSFLVSPNLRESLAPHSPPKGNTGARRSSGRVKPIAVYQCSPAKSGREKPIAVY
jgi:hypothetical protein